MSFAFMPVYTGDYHRDTRHLTPEEHGCYLLLLIHCWDQKGPIPLDERRQCGIVNARSGGEIESLRRVLAEFFVRMDDGWYNPRMSEEIARAEQISAGRRKGGLEKARRMRDAVRHAQAVHKQSTSSASAGTPTLTPTLTPTPTPRPSASQDLPLSETSQTSEKRAEAKKDARASRFAPLPIMPADWRAYCQVKRPDLNPDTTYERFSNFWVAKPGAAGRKLDWTATWRNWVLDEKPARATGNTKAGQAERVAQMLFGNHAEAIDGQA